MQQHEILAAKKRRGEAEVKDLPKNRKTKRRLQRHRTGGAPHTRITSKTRTGTTPHFQLWMADLKLMSALKKTKTAKLAESAHPSALVRSAFALLHNADVKNVYAVTRLTIEELLAIEGIGVKKAEALQAYLAQNNVKTQWTVAA